MRIRSIEIQNWACIDSLQLTELRDGVVILHGPNRTGKSSLVQAVRSCLFDHQHDSQDAVILGAVPRRTKATPAVTVEFEHAKQRYRIKKTFAKGRFGETWLEHLSTGGWSVLERGKTAAKKARDIAGATGSEAGIFQMLWLNQQDFRLPVQKDLDPSLKKSLETVLGSLITGPDVDFKQRLDRACDRWFTGAMKERKESPVARLKADVDQARAAHELVERRFREAEAALRQLDEATSKHPVLQRDLGQADEELARLQADRQALEVRKAQHDLAVRNRAQAQQLLQQAQQRLHEWTTDSERLKVAQQSLGENQSTAQTAAENVRRAEQDAAQARTRHQDAEKALDEHRLLRAALDDQQQLLNLTQRSQALEQTLAQLDEHAQRLKELGPALTGPAAVSEEEIEELRHKHAEALKLHAQLEAAEIHVTLHAKKAVDARASIDDKPEKKASVAAGKEQRWRIRQQAELTIGALATLRIGRAQEDRALEDLARRCAELDRQIAQRLKEAQAASIDDLVERRVEREALVKEASRHREALARAAPVGLAGLHAERSALLEQMNALIKGRPELAAWTVNLPELDAMKREFAERDATHKANLQTAKQALAASENGFQQALTRQQSVTATIVEATVAVRTLTEKLAQRDGAVLTAAVQDATTRLAEAQADVAGAALSEADQAIETRYQAAAQTQRQRALRNRENEDALLRLQTQLDGTEGLHQQRIQAEQTLADYQRHGEREALHANAHRRLKELYEEIHADQVRRTALPINDRVMRWAHKLGLADYRSLAFGTDLLPAGLESIHAPAGSAVALDQESFGTVEQLSLLIRLAVGGLLARDEPTVALLDDPLAHADLGKHDRMLEILQEVARGEDGAGPLQILVLTCHPERFASLADAQQIDLAAPIRHGG